MTKLNNKGMALIAAVVTAVIFLMLVIAVTVISVATYKKSGQGHDRAMALNLAEAGINYTLYCMNYRYYDTIHFYPASDGLYFKSTDGTWNTGAGYSDCYYNPSTGSFTTAMPGFQVRFLDGNSVSPPPPTPNTNEDILESTGYYNGKRRTIQIKIRGTNINGQPLNTVNHGIAEAFNKHAVYARTVNYTSPTTVIGNVITESVKPGIVVADRTWTQVTSINNTPAVTINPGADIFPDPGSGSCTERYVAGWDGVTSFDSLYGPGAYAGGVYTFKEQTVAYSVETDGPIVFSGTNTVSNFVRATSGTITMGGTMIININAAFFASGGVTVNGLTTQAAGTGVIAVRDSNLTLSGNPSFINSAGSTKNAAIMLYTTGVHTLAVGVAPTIILNSDNQTGCLVYSSSGWPVGTNSVSLTSGLILTTPFNRAPTAVVAYSLSENARININTGETIDGLIYAVSGGDSTKEARIVLTAGIVGDVTYGGLLVAGGTVNAAPARANGIIDLIDGTVRFRGGNYYAFSQLPNVYSNLFFDGQRVYLPVPGSWREK